MTYPKIILKRRKDMAVRRFHPWVFSGAIYHTDSNTQDGDIVEIYAANDDFLALGHYQERGSISVRILSFKQQQLDTDFWTTKLKKAYALRQTLGLSDNASTNAYRLVHAEGDELSGLIIDIYKDVAVIQCHSLGMLRQINLIAKSLHQVYDGRLTAIYNKSKATLPASSIENKYLIGNSSPLSILENGLKFFIDWERGQKTGFFLDQRDNRQLLKQFSTGKKVLNTFCYSGGFSLYALQAGATLVHSVDSSKKAIEWTDTNVELNAPFKGEHKSYVSDVSDFLRECTEEYDIVVVDPPAYAKRIKSRHNAIQAYKRLNALAMQKIKPGGLLFTFSCSQVVDRVMFENTIVAAALEAGYQARVLYRLPQPADHPINLFHPEGSYLKGLVVQLS